MLKSSLFARLSFARGWTAVASSALLSVVATGPRAQAAPPPEPGLLFYLSGDHGTTADHSAPGTAEPNFATEVSTIPDGVKGAGIRCGDVLRYTYWAAGNVYAQRGSLSFFWRAREPVGPTEFPIFRVGYADHSSWDMVWLRIDYNGHGFDAFVTDASLSRIRVSTTLTPFPGPDKWVHLALSWDESRGIRFYVNGQLAATTDKKAVLDAGLDQFGPFQRIVSPYQVQSDYNFVRGGDIDELRIYDRALSDEAVAALARLEAPTSMATLNPRELSDARWRDEWALRFGWNRPDDLPPALPGTRSTIRKVEIHEAHDLKRWWWKANDGIRETTWPGVFNRSRLPGRNDYFQIPDWDCYSLSGKSIVFTMPQEPWNHVEISGAAWGRLTLLQGEQASPTDSLLFERPKGQERTASRLPRPVVGQKVQFENVLQEEPIGEFAAYDVEEGREPAGTVGLAYRLASVAPQQGSLASLVTFIRGRYPADERATLVAVPDGAPTASQPKRVSPPKGSLPLVHILIPTESAVATFDLDRVDGGLDGIAIDLPALSGKTPSGALVPMNVRVMDPLWPQREMLGFTFSVKPGEPKTLWLDLRDRILPPGKGLYLAIASVNPEFGTATLAGARLRLVFKSKDAARVEHEIDRFTQVKDAFAMSVEEGPRGPKFALAARIEADLSDLLRVNPNHELGRIYRAALSFGSTRPAFTQPSAPAGVPLWAFRQVEALRRAKRFVTWWIDHRQIDNGEFGGGLSDDTDLTNLWPGLALMGVEPDRLKDSLRRTLDACYRQGLFTNGLPAIQADELHSYEEGINALGQNLILDFGSPRQLERAMETTRGIMGITGVNAAGHRHFRTSYYSGTKMAEDGVWGRAKAYSYLVLQTPELLVDYSGSPSAKAFSLEMADGLLAHRRQGADGRFRLPSAIHFKTDQDDVATRPYFPWHVFWTAWQWTGNRSYLDPIFDGGAPSLGGLNANALDALDVRKTWGEKFLASEEPPAGAPRGSGRGSRGRNLGFGTLHYAWQLGGDKKPLEQLYATQIEWMALGEYVNTEGSLWTDRVSVPTGELQRARLGGVALVRNSVMPGHVVSWRFRAPATEESLAVLIPDATPRSFTVIAYNLDAAPVVADMTGWGVEPGEWEISSGVDTNGDDKADHDLVTRTARFERSRSVELSFGPRATTVLHLRLLKATTPYWARPDLGIDRQDVEVLGREVRVRVHSLGSVPSPLATIVLRDRSGRIVATERLAPLAPPLDLFPKTDDAAFSLPAGVTADGATVEIDPDGEIDEITRMNNVVQL